MSTKYNPATGQYESQGFDAGIFGYDGMNFGDTEVDYSALPSFGMDTSYSPNTGSGNGGLFDYMGSSSFANTAGAFGDIAGGIGGLYGMYLGKEQLDDQKKNNKLYRRLADEQNTRRVGFEGAVKSAFA